MPYSHLTNAVISSDNISEHDFEMIQKDVPVRIGDEAVELNTVELDEPEERTEITLNTETGEVEGESESGEELGEEEAEGEPEVEQEAEPKEESIEFKADPAEMDDASKLVREAQEGQDEMFKQAIEKGLDAELIEEMQANYMETGRLTKAHYAALAEAGYTKAFIDSYIKGQDAVAEKFSRAVMNYCGGEENYAKVTTFMASKMNHMVDPFNAAIERGDTATMRALLDATRTAMGQTKADAPKESKAPKRNIAAAAKAKPRAASAAKVEGYRTKAEMVKDMSNPQYGRDPEFRRMVELKVLNAHF
ncbi:MAG: capsid assembly protein [Cetobacterium sp.]|uniref:capsid assembly protein n=1 Tax=Cetobacterium sp. TaxID=2071632 RepID=UPI003EE7453A